MAQPISPMIWNKAALTDNRLLPARYSIGIFTGKGVNIANNEEAYAYDDIIVSDRIFDYDDRRLNGLANYATNTGFNADGRDGWGASAYGPFQTVRFTRRVFTSGQHKSIAWRIFDEKQYAGDIGEFGSATKSYAYTGGEAYLSTAETINKAKKIWDAEILGPHIDKYNFFAIANGHIAGRFVQTHAAEGAMFDCDGTWIASPGPYQGLSFQPEFAPIKAVEWDALNARPLLNAIDVAWTNLFIPQDNRVILLDKAYKDDLLSNLVGIPGTVPQTEKAYDALVEGRFERFYGWDFDFSIPSQYFPQVYVDDNNNVVHSADGTGAYDALMISIAADDGVLKLQNELAAAGRQRATNYIGTYWDKTTGAFVNEVTNYALSMPSGAPYYGDKEAWQDDIEDWEVTSLSDFPWMGFPGQGLDPENAPEWLDEYGPVGTPRKVQVVGMAVYRPAAQLGEEYGYMETDRGKTRGKFTELVFDMKHDAWVIPNYSHGIILFIDEQASLGTPSVKVELVDNSGPAEVTGITVSEEELALAAKAQGVVGVTVTGTGNYDKTWTAISSDTSKATVDANGVITAVAAGSATITFTANGDPEQTAEVEVTVS